MNTPIVIKIECAKGEIMNAMQQIQNKYALPPCIIDGLISSILAEVRAESKLELLNATSAAMRETEEEIKKAKAAAKKVLKEETDQVSESDTGQQGGHPEEEKEECREEAKE